MGEDVAAHLEVSPDELVEAEHVLLLGELNVVGDVLEDLGHEHQVALDGEGDDCEPLRSLEDGGEQVLDLEDGDNHL